MGGVPFIEIQKKDCKILKFGHGKWKWKVSNNRLNPHPLGEAKNNKR
jgi:hypothetical protein